MRSASCWRGTSCRSRRWNGAWPRSSDEVSKALLLGALLLCSPALAQTLEIPLASKATRSPAHHGRVEAREAGAFRLADEEHLAVGQPPITRWDYRSFSVYFEYDHVINSVLHHQPHHPLDKDQP